MQNPLACREMCGSLRTRRGLLQEYRKETLKKMLLRPPNLDFITQRNKSTPKETISNCSRKKCHFNMKVLLWNQESDRTLPTMAVLWRKIPLSSHHLINKSHKASWQLQNFSTHKEK